MIVTILVTKNYDMIYRRNASALCHKVPGEAGGFLMTRRHASYEVRCMLGGFASKLNPHFVGIQHKVPTSSNALRINHIVVFLFKNKFTGVTFYIHILDTIGLYNLKHKVK